MQPGEEYAYQNIAPESPSLRKRLVAILVVLAVIVCGLLVFTALKNARFRVLTTNPVTTDVSTISPFFKVTFNKQLSGSASLSSTNSIVHSYTTSGDTLNITLNSPLLSGRSYTITINSIESSDGNHITNRAFTFTPRYIPYGNLPKDQQQALIKNQDHYTAAQQDPIVDHLPYSSIDFSLSPTFPAGKDGKTELVLQAQLLLPPGVTGVEAAADAKQYKQEVLDYISSLGLNPAKYKINYEVVNESLTGV